MKRETFKMIHPERGTGQCSEEQWPEFAATGWSRDMNENGVPDHKPRKPRKQRGSEAAE